MAAQKQRKRLRQRVSGARTTLCKEGGYLLVIMAFLLVAAWLRQINLLFLIFSGLTIPLVWNVYFVRASLKNLSFRRHAPATCVAGDRVVIDIEATNHRKRRRSWAVVAADTLRLVNADESRRKATSHPAKAAVVFSRINPGETVRESYEGRLPQRGEYRLGPIVVSTRFPMGLVKRTYRVKSAQTMIVHPRQGRLTQHWKERSARSFQGGVSVAQQLGVVEAEYHGMREFRSGDSLSWIHWRTTARRGEPIVRQFEQQRSLDLTVVLDLWIPQKPSLHHLETVEIAVSFAATLIATQGRTGLGQLVVATFRREPMLTTGTASHALLREVQNDLALARCSKRDHLPALLASSLIRGKSRKGEVVVVSTRANDFSDAERFQQLRDYSARDDWRSRITHVNCASPELAQVFQIPGDGSTDGVVASAPPRHADSRAETSRESAELVAAARQPADQNSLRLEIDLDAYQGDAES